MPEYLLGLLTTPALLVAGWTIASIASWLLWWRHPGSNGGKGFEHTLDVREDDHWFPHTTHVHFWSSETPWWLIRSLEPLRTWICLRDPDHRSATPPEAERL